MSRTPDGDLGISLAVHLLGMAVPILLVALIYSPYPGSRPNGPLVLASAAGFFAVSWAFLQRTDTDNIDYMMAAVIGPGLAFIALVGTQVVLWQLINFYPGLGLQGLASFWHGVLETVAPAGLGLFGYVSSFGVAGFAAAGLSRREERAGSAAEAS